MLISDTHSRHEGLGELPAGDLLIHAGDFTQARPSKPKVVDYFLILTGYLNI